MALTNSQYDAIMREYNKRQFHSAHKLDEHIKEVYEKDKRFEQIDSKISSLSLECARKLLNNENTSVSDLQKTISRYSKMRIQILLELGYPDNYLERSFVCPYCKDTGYIGSAKCHCFKKLTIDMLYTQSNLKNILKEENFSNFSYNYYSNTFIDPISKTSSLEVAKNAVKECRKFIDNFDKTFNNIFLYGDTGVGKTFLSNCMARELLDSSHSVIYFTAFELFDVLAHNTFDRDKNYTMESSYIYDCDLLIIDDLGTELTNAFVSSQFFVCINERILRKKSTIISTNLSIDRLVSTYSERTFSRISSNYIMIKLIGDDIRIMKKLR